MEPTGPESPQNPELDIEKLHSLPSEQQDLYLLTFSSDLARHVASLDSDGASAHQIYVKKEVFKVLGLNSPAPTRVIRNNLGNSLSGIFGKGDRKLLFESVSELLSTVNSTKTAKDSTTKQAAVHCLGAVFEAAGDSVVSLSPVVCSTLLRVLKAAQNNTGLRVAVFKALGRVPRGIGKSLDETIARDIWKQARTSATNDKAVLVQSNACWCIGQLCLHTPYFDNSSDFDKLQTVLWKAIDNPSLSLRRSAAACLSGVFVKNFSKVAESTPRGRKLKKTKTQPVDGDEAENALERSGSPGPQAPATSLSFSLPDILQNLTNYYGRATTSNRIRAGVAMILTNVFRDLDDNIMEENYNTIVLHFFNEFQSAPSVFHNRFRVLITRKFIKTILGESISRKTLGETAQTNAIKFLVNGILKDYPQPEVKDRPEPAKQTIIATLDLLTTLMDCLGSATYTVSDICRTAILQVLEHPNYTVQIHAAKCLRMFALTCPQQMIPVVTICMNSVNREIRQLTSPRRSPRRCIGYAFGLAAALSTSSLRPLYGSVDVFSRVLEQATAILKSSSGADLRISSTQIQVAWIMIGGLMSLGPSFVKIHLSQFLLMWRNALPKPMSKENVRQSDVLELSFLTHVRECALGAIRAFVEFNSRLLTLDVCNRLATMLQNTTEFLNSLPAKKTTEDMEKRLSHALQLQDYDLMVRRRVFQCYTQLLNRSPSESRDSFTQSSILTFAVSCFTDPENVSNTSLSSSIATSSGNLDTVWDLGDNSGFGVTSFVNGLHISSIDEESGSAQSRMETSDSVINHTIHAPMCGSAEHDSQHLYVGTNSRLPPPLGTAVVDAAIELFAASIPLQGHRVQEGALEHIETILSSSVSQRNAAKDVAVAINICTALLFTLQVFCGESASPSITLKAAEVEKAIQDLLHRYVAHPDQSVRHIAAQCLGRLCKCSGNEFTSREVKHLIDWIVSNRDPDARSGCAMALGCINSELGGMAAGFHLKNIHSVLASLASDPHPTVHYWALDGLSKIADTAGLAFSGYVNSTLGMVAQLYVAESHGEESASIASSNLEVDMPSLTGIARCVDSMINVLGPDLQDMSKARNMILTLTYQFQTETSPLATSESLKCLENLSMYAPGHISFGPYVRQLQSKLPSDDPGVRNTALTGLYNAMRRGAEEVLVTAETQLEDQMWEVLHDSYGEGIMRAIIQDWVQQSGVERIDVWVQRVQKILTKIKSQNTPLTTSKSANKAKVPDLNDEEATGFAAAAAETAKDDLNVTAEASQELLRWQVRYTSLESLNQILSTVAKEVFDYGESSHIPSLQSRVAEIIKIAFSASTASVVELRIQGIQIIGRVLQIFGKVPDPDFPEATLLEQYQAQISSALTPAFAADSSPILAAEAVGVCAAFISTGIVTNADRMGRILRLLVSALEDFSKDTESASIGDLKGLSSNAKIMVRLAVYSAWAELQIASREQTYLQDIIKPHLAKLTPLWLSSLREYARLKFEPDISTAAASGAMVGGLDTIYAAFSRETLLTFYQASWLNFVNAIASLIEEDSELVFNALDEKSESTEENGDPKKGSDINYRDEPVAFFFVLFGICFEALTSRAGIDAPGSQQRTLDIIQAMHKILRPNIAGLAIYRDDVFSETMDLLDRLVLTEGLDTQTVIVQIARNLCLAHPSARRSSEPDREEQISDDIEQLFELTRIIVLVIAKHVPNLSEQPGGTTHPQSSMNPITKETTALITLATTSLVSSADVFPSIIKADLHACILHIFCTILASPTTQDDVVPRALPIFRRFATALARNPQHETATQLRSTLARFLSTLKVAHNREFAAAVTAEKNTLLAGTLLLSSASGIFNTATSSVGDESDGPDPLISRFVVELSECLSNTMTTQVAAGLSRSLLLLCTTSTAGPTEQVIASVLLPRLVAFLVLPCEAAGTDETRASVAHTLTTFVLALDTKKTFPSADDDGNQPVTIMQRSIALSLIIPALLRRARSEGPRTHKDTAIRLVEVAQEEPTGFREAVARLDGAEKEFLRGIVRQNEESDEEDEDGEGAGAFGEMGEGGAGPSIELKTEF